MHNHVAYLCRNGESILHLTFGMNRGRVLGKGLAAQNNPVSHKRNCGFFVSENRLGIWNPPNKALPNKVDRRIVRLLNSKCLFYCENGSQFNLLAKETI